MTEAEATFQPPRYERIAIACTLFLFAVVQVLAAQRIGFVFEYPLDDPYIHLAMASEIARGGYGVNTGEYASAASSALFPFLLTPFPDSGFQRFLPLIWNIVGLVIFAWLWGRAVLWAGIRGGAGLALAAAGPLFVGAVSTAYVGMEHTLHSAASLAIIFGLARILTEDRLNAMFFVGLTFSPILRFEGLALCTLALIVLVIRRRPYAAALGAILAYVPIGLFVYYLLSLGLDPLPNSVQAKLVSNEDADMNFVVRTFGTLGINLSKYGGLAISGLAATMFFITALTASGQSKAASAIGFALALGAVGVLSFVSFDVETYDVYVGPAVAVLLVGMLLMGIQLLRAIQHGTGNDAIIWLALVLVGGGFAHILFGQIGWMERYEHYMIAATALGVIIAAGLAAEYRRVALALAVVAIAVGGARYVHKTSVQYHWGSRAIHLQQYQMQRFAKEFLNRPVAVNDLGWVVWGNENYVLDLYGLANHEARNLRIYSPDPGWGGPLVAERNVSVIMIYEDFVGEAVADTWVPLGKLAMKNPRGYLGSGEVDFYASSEAEAAHARAALLAWRDTLLPDTCFVRHGEDKCWN